MLYSSWKSFSGPLWMRGLGISSQLGSTSTPAVCFWAEASTIFWGIRIPLCFPTTKSAFGVSENER